jgi:hypothetical protein
MIINVGETFKSFPNVHRKKPIILKEFMQNTEGSYFQRIRVWEIGFVKLRYPCLVFLPIFMAISIIPLLNNCGIMEKVIPCAQNKE